MIDEMREFLADYLLYYAVCICPRECKTEMGAAIIEYWEVRLDVIKKEMILAGHKVGPVRQDARQVAREGATPCPLPPEHRR